MAEDLMVVGVDTESIHFDPNPTVDMRDPDAYTRYAQKLDEWNPNWIWTNLDDMTPALRDEAIVRRTEPVIQAKVRLCMACDADLSDKMGCYVMYQRIEGGIAVAPNLVIMCVDCRTTLGRQTFTALEYHKMLDAAGKRRWAAKIKAQRTHTPALTPAEYIIDAFKNSPSGTFLTVAEIAVQGGDGSMGHAAIVTVLHAMKSGTVTLPGITFRRDATGRKGAYKS